MASSVYRVCLIVLLLAAIVCGAYATYSAVVRAHIPHQVDYEEGNVLNAAVRIDHGLTPYPDPNGWPVVLNPYGPVAYYLAAIPVKFLGPHFTAPRLIVIGATLLCALFVGLIISHVTQSTLAAISFGFLFLSHSLVKYWMAVLRVDLIGLAFALAGFYVFLRIPRWWVLSVVLFTASIYTKHTFIAAPTACVVFLLLEQKWQRTIEFCGLSLALGTSVFVGFDIATHGAFAFELLRTHPDPMVWSHYPTFYLFLLASNPILVITGAATVAWALYRRKFNFLTIYVLLAVLATASAGKLGSNDNHLLEVVALLFVFTAIAVVELKNQMPSLGAAICMLLAVWAVVKIPYGPINQPLQGCEMVYAYVGQFPSDHILSEDVGALVTNGKTVWVSNPFVYAQLAISGTKPDEQLQRHIADRWFDLIILSQDSEQLLQRFSPQVKALIEQNYRPAVGFPFCQDAGIAYLPRNKSR